MINPATIFVVCEMSAVSLDGATHSGTMVRDNPRATLKHVKEVARAYGVELRFVALVRWSDLLRWCEQHDVRMMVEYAFTPEPPLEWVSLPPGYKWPWSHRHGRS